MTVKEGTDSAAQRNKRAAILGQVLEGIFETKDSTRTFNEQQRRLLWHRSSSKTCGICHKRIDKWEDMHADHIQPYVKGGPTCLDNGAISHKACNLSKGAG